MLLDLTPYLYSPTSEEKMTHKKAGIKLYLLCTGTGFIVLQVVKAGAAGPSLVGPKLGLYLFNPLPDPLVTG